MQTLLSVNSRSTRLALSQGRLLKKAGGRRSRSTSKVVNNDVEHRSHVDDPDTIPANIIDALPKPLGDGAGLLGTEHERGVFLTSALGVLSGCLPNVLGRHADGDMPLNLFTAVEAPAGSGKGALRYARRLGQLVDDRLRLTSEGGSAGTRASLYLAGNSSERALIEAVHSNSGTGVIIESEGITLAKLFGSIGGDATDLLLKSFHQEPVTVSRKGLRLHIPSPSLSVVVSGTPETLKGIIAGTESGLLSRFAVYSFTAAPTWKSHRPNRQSSARDSYFDEAAVRIDRLHQQLEERAENGAGALVIRLKDKHWDSIDTAFETELAALWASGANPALEASVKRAAIIAFRITCILTVLRAFERGRRLKEIEELTAIDVDASTGLGLALLYLKHTLRVAARLHLQAFQPRDQRKAGFYSALPAGEFTTGTAVEIGGNMNPAVPLRTVMRYLDAFVADGLLQRKKQGTYEKREPMA